MEINIKYDVPIRRIQDMLCCAFEGGSNYWYMIEEFHKPSTFTNLFDTPFGDAKPQVFKHIDYPTNPGGWLIVSDSKLGAEIEKVTKKRLDLDACMKGLQTMAEKYQRHFNDMLRDNDDAITGDVFLQCCIFGDVIYG